MPELLKRPELELPPVPDLEKPKSEVPEPEQRLNFDDNGRAVEISETAAAETVVIPPPQSEIQTPERQETQAATTDGEATPDEVKNFANGIIDPAGTNTAASQTFESFIRAKHTEDLQNKTPK